MIKLIEKNAFQCKKLFHINMGNNIFGYFYEQPWESTENLYSGNNNFICSRYNCMHLTYVYNKISHLIFRHVFYDSYFMLDMFYYYIYI